MLPDKSAGFREVPWELLAVVAGLVALLLPVAGAVQRVVSFAVSSNRVPAEIGAAIPVNELAVLGLFTVWPGLLAAILAYGLSMLPAPPSRAGSRSGRMIFFVMVTALVALGALSILFLPAPVPVPLIYLIAGYVAGKWFPLTGRVPFARWTLFAAGVTLAMAIGSGLNPSGASAWTVDVDFDSGEPSLTGRYWLVGRADGYLYLVPCRPDGLLLTIPADRVRSLTTLHVPPALPATVWEAITEGREYRLGFVPDCGEP